MLRLSTCLAAAALLGIGAAQAQPLPEGYLCCNMRSDGRWISDSNYLEQGKFTLPLGTPIKATEYGRYRVLVEVGGKPQTLGNDYSRDIAMPDFARRYIVSENPADKLATFEPDVRAAITSSRVMLGMTREQVLMALGYPISSENPHLDAQMWKYWLWSFSPYAVYFRPDGRVSHVRTDPDTRLRVLKE